VTYSRPKKEYTLMTPSPAPFPIPVQPDMTVPAGPLPDDEILRRIEVVRRNDAGDEIVTGIGNLCDNTNLPVPWTIHSSPLSSKKDVFWFTERGWTEYGDQLYRPMERRPAMYVGPNAEIRLREIRAEGQYLSYRDPYQVAIRAPWRVWHVRHGGDELIVAARSRAEAARHFGISTTKLTTWGSVTGNLTHIAAANAHPGTVIRLE
jgi:hypothetical protein